jgi:hypothetical protein
LTIALPAPQSYPLPTLNRETAINIFRALDEAGFAPALSVPEKNTYLIHLHIDGMGSAHVQKAFGVVERAATPNDVVIRVEGEYLVVR